MELVDGVDFSVNVISKSGTTTEPAVAFRFFRELLDLIGDRDFSVNVISKSGTTTEPAVAFRIFREKLEAKYGKEGARERIYATTDAHKGALKGLADREGYEEFIVPDDIGGRFSVLTAVGPVSYTHLDVYKRQISYIVSIRSSFQTCRPGSSGRPAGDVPAVRPEYRAGFVRGDRTV